MLLVESSIWINHLRGIRRVDHILTNHVIVTCPPVIQEVLQGVKPTARFEKLHQSLISLKMLDAPMPLQRFEEAARLYLLCRDNGFNIRSSVDCLIAASAIAHGVALFQVDRDYVHIAKVSPLKLFTPSPA